MKEEIRQVIDKTEEIIMRDLEIMITKEIDIKRKNPLFQKELLRK
jgi:hypothetical protein